MKVNKEKDLSRWQGLEIHYPFLNLSRGSSAADLALDALKKFIFPDNVPAVCKKVVFTLNVNELYGSLQRYWLRNMSCIYKCEDSLELATPECPNHYEVTCYDKVADIYAYIAAKVASEERGVPVTVYKRTYELALSATRGCHESYHSSKSFHRGLSSILTPFFVIRPIFSGSGGYIDINKKDFKFVLSPRVFRYDPSYFYVDREYESFSASGYRLHFKIGESLKNEWTRFITNGLTSYIISIAEDEIIKSIPKVKDKDIADNMREISSNPNGEWKIKFENGKSEDAISFFNSYYLDAIEKLFGNRIINDWDRLTLEKTKYIVDKLGSGNIEDCNKYLQWVEMKHFIENPEKYEIESIEKVPKEEVEEYKSNFGEEWNKILLCDMFTEILGGSRITDLLLKDKGDIDIHEIIADKLFGDDRLLTEEEIAKRVTDPPPGRARLRKEIIETFEEKYDLLMSWDSWAIIYMYHNQWSVGKSPNLQWSINKVDWSEEEIKSYIEEIKKYIKLYKAGSV